MDDKKPCSKCGGTGRIEIDDLTVRQCLCAFARAMKEHLGAEIALAKSLQTSPLFVAGDPEPSVDRTKDNLFLKGYWQDLLPHFKSALVGKGLFFSFTVVKDEKLKTVYVGDESYKARSKNKRDDIQTHNSLGDIVGPEIDLAIIRLGFLGHPNRAMPGIIKETIMLRDAPSKATWLIEDPDQGYFGPGHLSYSEELAEYIDAHFEVVDLTNKSRTPLPPERVVSVVEDVGMDAPLPVARVHVERSRFESRNDDLLGALSGGKNRKPKKRGSSGGPLG